MLITRPHKRPVNLWVQMQKVRPNRPNRTSSQALRSQNNQCKRLLVQKNPLVNRLRRKPNKWQELMQQVRLSQQKSTSSRELKIWEIVLRKQQVMRIRLFNKLSRMWQKDCKTLRKVRRMYMRTHRRSWDRWGVQLNKQLDKRQNKRAKLWNKRVTKCKRMPDWFTLILFLRFDYKIVGEKLISEIALLIFLMLFCLE